MVNKYNSNQISGLPVMADSNSAVDDLCKVCGKKCKVKSVFCDGFCRKWLHFECAKFSSEDSVNFEALAKNLDSLKWYCSECNVNLTKVINKVGSVDDFLNLNDTVSQLVQLVKGVVNDNVTLNKKLDNLTSDKVSANINNKRGQQAEVVIEQEDLNLANDITNVNARSSVAKKSVNCAGNSETEVTEERRSGTVSLSQSVQSASSNVNKKFSDVVKNGKKLPKPVIGCKPTSESGSLKAVERRLWVFVSRLHPQTSKEDVEKYLTDNSVSDFQCEKLTARYNSYSSFKIGIPTELEGKVLSPDFWLAGTLVSHYIPKRNRTDFIRGQTFLRSSLHPPPK